MKPMEAALKGAGEIGFTIVSISLSLIAVFIPLLLMSGIVGPPIPRVRDDGDDCRHGLGRRVADPHADDVLTLPETRNGRARPPLSRGRSACSRGWSAFYRRTLDVALRFQFLTLLTFLATLALTVALYVYIPKGFFPQQDTGVVMGVTEGAQDVSFAEMSRLQQELANVIASDPDVSGYSSTVGAGYGGQTGNNGRIYISLEPWAERTGGSAQDFINRIRPKLAKVEGANLYLQAAQDINVGGRLSRDPVPIHAPGREYRRAIRSGRPRSCNG